MSMTSLIIEKLQGILGSNYVVYNDNAFDHRFTLPNNQDIDFQAFDSLKDNVIPCRFILTPAQYNKAPFLSYNTRYRLETWVRIDNLKMNNYGELIETPIDTYEDLTNLRKELQNTTITFSVHETEYSFDDEDDFEDWLAGTFTRLDEVEPANLVYRDVITIGATKTYEVKTTPATSIDDFADYYYLRGEMTFSEPSYGKIVDKTGQGRRIVLAVDGLINLTDYGVLASDTVVKIGLWDPSDPDDLEDVTYYDITNFRTRRFTADPDGITTQTQGSIQPNTSDPQTYMNSITFNFDDYSTANTAVIYFREMALFKNVPTKNFPVKIYQGATMISSCLAQIKAEYVNQTGVGEVLELTIIRAGDLE